MAERVLFIGWKESARGREERALEVFDEAVAMCGAFQEAQAIDHFDVALLGPNADLGGYIAVHGSARQIAAVHEDDRFRRTMAEAALCVDDLRHIDGFTNEGAAAQLALYREAVSRTPQTV
jgi:hypothetical protein